MVVSVVTQVSVGGDVGLPLAGQLHGGRPHRRRRPRKDRKLYVRDQIARRHRPQRGLGDQRPGTPAHSTRAPHVHTVTHRTRTPHAPHARADNSHAGSEVEVHSAVPAAHVLTTPAGAAAGRVRPGRPLQTTYVGHRNTGPRYLRIGCLTPTQTQTQTQTQLSM